MNWTLKFITFFIVLYRILLTKKNCLKLWVFPLIFSHTILNKFAVLPWIRLCLCCPLMLVSFFYMFFFSTFALFFLFSLIYQKLNLQILLLVIISLFNGTSFFWIYCPYLLFKYHIDLIKIKVSSSLGIIRKLKHLFPGSFFRSFPSVYFSPRIRIILLFRCHPFPCH